MRRLQGSHVPLVDGVVRDSGEADFAIAPGLGPGPFDAEIKVTGLSGREVVDVSWGATTASRVNSHADVSIRNPFLRVDDLPILIFIRGTLCHIRVLIGHSLPLIRVTLLERKALCIGAVSQDDGILSFLRGAVDIGPKDEAIVHGDRNIPVHPHSILEFALVTHLLSSRWLVILDGL
jgi:hypothetical protein